MTETDKYGKLIREASVLVRERFLDDVNVQALAHEAATLAVGRDVHSISDFDDVAWYAAQSEFLVKVLMSSAMAQSWVRDDGGQYLHLQEDHGTVYGSAIREDMTIERYHELLHDSNTFVAEHQHPIHNW